MSSTGVSIAYFITCLSALSCSVLIKKVIRTDLFIRHLPFWFDCIIYFPSVIVSAWITSIALNAVIYCFRWMVSNGLIFFVIRYPKLKRMDNDELSRLILNRSEKEVEDMVDDTYK